MGLLIVGMAGAGCAERRAVEAPAWDGWSDAPPPARVPLRVATWNVEGVGAADSPAWVALVDVLERLDADVVALNEVGEMEGADLDALAAELGYGEVVRDEDAPFGDLANALLSRVPVVGSEVLTGGDLSGTAARDLTRSVVVARVQAPGSGAEVGLVAMHFKSGFEPVDAFRRAVDAERARQALSRLGASDVALALGDVNAEPGQRFDPEVFEDEPAGLPETYALGADVAAVLSDGGLSSDPFEVLGTDGWTRLALRQRDGDEATRPTSGRIIDHVFVDGRADRIPVRGEVYGCDDDTPDQPGVADGDPLDNINSCLRAADHLPVVIELSLSAEE